MKMNSDSKLMVFWGVLGLLARCAAMGAVLWVLYIIAMAILDKV